MTTQFGAAQKIVIVEDNQALSDIYKTRLELLGYTVFAAYDGVQALTVIERELPDLVLLDLMVPKVAGDQVLERMRESDWGKDIKVMIISNLNETEAPAGLRNLGIEGYAVKANLSNDQLDKLVEVILKPAGQAEDVLLAQTAKTEVAHADPSGPPPDHTSADPLSGTRFQGGNENQPAAPDQTPSADDQTPAELEQSDQPAASPAHTTQPAEPTSATAQAIADAFASVGTDNETADQPADNAPADSAAPGELPPEDRAL